MPVEDAQTSLALDESLELLKADYRDLQAPICDILDEPPSSLEALRMIHKSHPAVIHGVLPMTSLADELDWDEPEVYETILKDRKVSIAITDDGLADSVRTLPNGSTTFVKPLEEKMSIPAFLNRLRDPEESEVLYLQSQDGNIFRSEPHPNGQAPELAPFGAFVKRDLSWMKEATDCSSEAVNLWIGSSRSVTSLHHDPYENIYHVLSGSKTFTLISPIEGFWLDRERFHSPSTLHRTPSGLSPVRDPSPSYPVPWVSSTQIPPAVQPIVVEVRAGESLYLPAEWWHRVEQCPGPGGLCVAINYWYPSTLDASKYAYERLARRVARQAGWRGVIPVPGDDESFDS